jgi:hypothetical protein
VRERRQNRSEKRGEALALQFDQVAMEGGFDLIVLAGESGETIATGSVMDQDIARAFAALGASALKLHLTLDGLLPPDCCEELHVGSAGTSKIHLKFFEYHDQRLVIVARSFKATCDPALLKRLSMGAHRILEARELSSR